jgi:hypothetical protein
MEKGSINVMQKSFHNVSVATVVAAVVFIVVVVAVVTTVLF